MSGCLHFMGTSKYSFSYACLKSAEVLHNANTTSSTPVKLLAALVSSVISAVVIPLALLEGVARKLLSNILLARGPLTEGSCVANFHAALVGEDDPSSSGIMLQHITISAIASNRAWGVFTPSAQLQSIDSIIATNTVCRILAKPNEEE